MIEFTLHDQHVHSKYSLDSKQELEPYIHKAIQLHCAYFVTTDHLDIGMPFGKDWTIDFDSYEKELIALQKKYPQIQLLKGVELGYMQSKIEQMKQICKLHSFDVINLSIHYNNEIDYYQKDYFKKYGIKQTLNIYFDNIIEALLNFNDFQVLSHIDYGFKTAFLIDSSICIELFEEKIKKIFTLLINKEKSLEINTKVQKMLPISHTKYLLTLYYQLGGRKLTLSSDAHQLSQYGNQFEKYLILIKEIGFKYLCYYVHQKENHYQI